jgi:hypothetical protein
MKLYKLTTKEHTTYRGSMHWKVGKTNKVEKCKNPQLCTGQVVHAYKNRNLALLLNPVHANIDDPVLWECEGKIVVEDFDKVGVFSLKANKILRLPKWHTERRKDVVVMFAILCAEAVIDVYEKKYPDDKRPREAIEAVKQYLKTKTKSAAYAARAAADAAADAASAADAAAYAAAYAAYAAADAAHAAADAAYAAELQRCAELVRRRISWDVIETAIAAQAAGWEQ